MEEQIDVLNDDGTFAGFSCGRTRIHSKGLWHRTVHIWAFDKNSRILFQQRSFKKESNPGLWDTSCAGHIGAGDSSAHAAIRELSEELGITKNICDLEYLFEASHKSVLNNGTYLDNEYYDVYKIILSDTEAKNLVPQPGEVECFEWLTVSEFAKRYNQNPELFVSHPKDYKWLTRSI